MRPAAGADPEPPRHHDPSGKARIWLTVAVRSLTSAQRTGAGLEDRAARQSWWQQSAWSGAEPLQRSPQHRGNRSCCPLRKALAYLGRHQPRIVPQRGEPARAQVMDADTRLPCRRDRSGRLASLASSCRRDALQAQNDGAALVETDEVEGVLADVDAGNGDGVFGMASMAGPCSWSPPTRGYCENTAGPFH